MKLPSAKKSIRVCINLHTPPATLFYLGFGNLGRTYLGYGIVAKISRHSVNLKTLAVFPCQKRNSSIWQLLNKITLHIYIGCPEINIVLPWQNLNGRIRLMTLPGNNLNSPGPISGPVLNITLVGAVMTPPLFIPETLRKQNVTFYIRKIIYNITNQFP